MNQKTVVMNKDYIKAFDGAERRFAVNGMTVEKRAGEAEGDAESFVVEGYAALFNSPTEIGGWFREVILPGAFDDVLENDVRALFNHDPNQILARTTSKTLEIGVDKKGLWYRFAIPNRSFANDLADAITKGDVSQSSFAFRAKETNWVYVKDELETREIVKVEQLYDVSPVTYPAYADTSVAQRSHDAYINELEVRDARTGENKELSLIDAQILINENQL